MKEKTCEFFLSSKKVFILANVYIFNFSIILSICKNIKNHFSLQLHFQLDPMWDFFKGDIYKLQKFSGVMH